MSVRFNDDGMLEFSLIINGKVKKNNSMMKIKTLSFSFLLLSLALVACGKDDVKGGDGGNEGDEVSDSDSVSDTTNGAGSYDGEIDWEW